MLFDLQRAVQSALQTVIGRELELDDEFPLVARPARKSCRPWPADKPSKRGKAPPPAARPQARGGRRNRSNGPNCRSSAPNPRFHHRNRKASEFCSGSSARSRIAARIGVSVKLTKSDTSVAMPIVTANGTRKRPTSEPIIAIGPNTTTFVMADAKTGRATSAAPLSAAVFGSSPRSRCLAIFSMTTIELVTSVPTEVPSASSEEMLNVKPQRSIAQNERRSKPASI